MTPLTAVLSKPWTFSSLVIVWQLQTRTIVTLRAAPGFTLCKNKVCKTDKRPLSLTIYFLWRYRMYNFQSSKLYLPIIWNASTNHTQNENLYVYTRKQVSVCKAWTFHDQFRSFLAEIVSVLERSRNSFQMI